MRFRRIVAAGGLAVALALGAVPGVSAAAAPHPSVWFDRTPPVGWVDGDGRHSVVVREGYPTDSAWLRIFDEDQDVVREVDLDWPDPAGDGHQRVVLASDDAGAMVVAVAGNDLAELWLNRFEADGDPIGSTVVITGGEIPVLGLPDGSLLTSDPAGDDTVWRGPDGAERARLGAPWSDVSGATVDASGRLLTAQADGKVRRWADGGSSDLTVDAACDASGGFTVVADAAGGFGSACGSSTGPLTMQVTRYAEDGTPAWTLATTPEEFGIIDPVAGVIDGSGRMWIVGQACRDLQSTPVERCRLPAQIIRAYTASGADQDSTTIAYAGGYAVPDVQLRSSGPDLDVARSIPPDILPNTLWKDGSTFGFSMPETIPPPTCQVQAPTVTAVTSQRATVQFQGCRITNDRAELEHNPTQYRLEAIGPAGAIAATTILPIGGSYAQQDGTVVGLEGGVRYRFQVRGENSAGIGPLPWDARSAGMTPPFADQPSFVDQQYTDLVGRAPTDQERANVIATLDFESATPASTVDALLAKPWSGPSVDPLARLYRAYFGRNADPSGLRYWVAKRRAGTTLIRISNVFADSSEFRTKYGSLSNRAFVERIYQNVLGRPGDPGGVDYWTGQLDRRRKSRGQVMINFSESSEFIRTSQPDIDVVAVSFGLLNRAPTAAEAAQWVPDLASGTPRTELIGAVLGSEEYRARVAS